MRKFLDNLVLGNQKNKKRQCLKTDRNIGVSFWAITYVKTDNSYVDGTRCDFIVIHEKQIGPTQNTDVPSKMDLWKATRSANPKIKKSKKFKKSLSMMASCSLGSLQRRVPQARRYTSCMVTWNGSFPAKHIHVLSQ